MRPTPIRASSALRHLTRPTIRARRLFTSSFFLATFCGAILTVSLSTLLPCPARVAPGQYRRRSEREQQSSSVGVDDENTSRSPPALVQGERIHLTKKDGWIEID